MPGKVSGDVALNVPGVTLQGSLSVEINGTTSAVNESVLIGGSQVGLALPAGKFVRVVGQNVVLNILGQQVSGNFALERITVGNPPRQVTRLSIDNAAVSFTNGTTELVGLHGASANLIVNTIGVAGSFSGQLTTNLPAVQFTGNFNVEINTTGAAVNESLTSAGGQTVSISLPAGQFLRISATGAAWRFSDRNWKATLRLNRPLIRPTRDR